MSCGAEIEAKTLINSLTSELSFTIPEIDFNDPLLNIPGGLDGEMYQVIKKLDIKELTTGEVGGDGAFDKLMASVYAHLKGEFDKGRITGAEYTKAYIELTQGVMANANQFVLNKDQAYWAAVNAQVAAIQARVAVLSAKVQVAALQLEVMNQKANYALTSMKVAGESQQYCISKFNLEYMLPMQLGMATAQKEGQLLENQTVQYTLSDMLPNQKAILIAEAAMKEVERTTAQSRLDNIMPLEIVGMTTDTNIKKYNLDNLLPEQLALAMTQREGQGFKNQIDSFTFAQILPKQLSISEIQRMTAQYTFDNILPKQMLLTAEQIEVQRAQTADTRSDAVTEITGVVGAQRRLYAQQVLSYQRDSELKAAKLFSDAWTVQKTVDEGLLPPAAFTNSSLDVVLANIRSRNDLD